QIWAWKESRVKKIKKYIDHVFVILPFEQAFYKKHGIDAQFVGHPLLDELKTISISKERFMNSLKLSNEKPIIALLPGSRTQEIKLILQPIAEIVSAFPSYQFIVSKVAWQKHELYDQLPDSVHVLEGRTYQLLKVAEAAIVTSGTATLEAALIGTPQVVVYKANPISVLIARALVKIKFISLVNLIMDREVVTELIQGDVNPKRLKQELGAIISGGEKREAILSHYHELKSRLGEKGASEVVATQLLKIIKNR
ncbi:MAG: lipid-A-disaccharide synthase, partial [Salibacteraceae bacterium]